MFTPSSTYNSNNPYPYPYSSSSSFSSYPLVHHPLLSNIIPDTINNNASPSANTCFLLHDPALPLPFIPNPSPLISETLTNLQAQPLVSDYAPVGAKQDNIAQSQQHYGIPSNFLISKKPSAVSTKKDRHSKIYTSQGLRDRRVRLSIDIARKFFDLQDMLGFDKASTTLDWLFTKSRKAIQELQFASHCKNTNISTAGCGGGASSSTDQDCCEEDEVVSDSAAVNEVRKLRRVEKEREKAKKESREKARARARERTSHRMFTTTAAAAAANTSKGKSLVVVGNDDDDDNIERGTRDQEFKVIEESIVIKRKLKQPSNLMAVPSLSQNQIVDIPNKELPGFSNVNNATTAADYSSIFPNLSPNWDTNASIHGRSNICAIASMNLSTELQIFGKTWEECNNQRLH